MTFPCVSDTLFFFAFHSNCRKVLLRQAFPPPFFSYKRRPPLWRQFLADQSSIRKGRVKNWQGF